MRSTSASCRYNKLEHEHEHSHEPTHEHELEHDMNTDVNINLNQNLHVHAHGHEYDHGHGHGQGHGHGHGAMERDVGMIMTRVSIFHINFFFLRNTKQDETDGCPLEKMYFFQWSEG